MTSPDFFYPFGIELASSGASPGIGIRDAD
jgi:hypothetical protein